MKCFHVARRLGPFLGDIFPHVRTILKALVEGEGEDKLASRIRLIGQLGSVVPAISETLAKMTDEDCEYIIWACLAVVRVQQPKELGGGWAPITNQAGFSIETDAVAMLRLTAEVVRVNLAGFFPSSLLSGGETAKE